MKNGQSKTHSQRDGHELSQCHLFKIEAVEGFNETNPPTLPSFREL